MMMMNPVSRNATRWFLTVLTTVALSSAGTPEVAAQEPLDSVIPIDSLVVTVLGATNGLGAHLPYAVSVQTGRALQLGNTGFSLDEAIQGIPGLQIQNRYNYSVGDRISIRGFGSRAQFGARGLKIFVDGIPATMADGQSTLDHLDIGSLGRVEVMRGPAAALFGNGGGAALSFQTKAPPDEAIREEDTAIFGQNGLMRFQSTTSGTSNGGTSYLLTVAHLTYDGFRTVADSSLFAEPRSDSSRYGLAQRLNVNGQVGLEAGAGRLLFTANFMDLDAESPGGLNHNDMYIDESLNARGGGFGNVAKNARKDVYQGQLGATWTGPVGGLNAEFVGWGLFRRMDNPIPPRIIDLARNAFGVRAVVSSETAVDAGDVSWAAGFDVNLQRDDRKNYTNDAGQRGTETLNQFETVSATGVFLQANANLSENFSLVGALRYDRFDFGVTDALLSDGDDSGSRVMDALSPTVGITIRPKPGLSIFANYATSLATPSTTELSNNPDGSGGFNPDLDPQTGRTGEVGLRGQAGGRVGYEVSGFVTRLKNELVPFEVASQPGRVFFRNSGQSTYSGFEASVRSALPSGLYGQLSYTFVNAKFDDYQVDDGATIEIFDGNVVPGAAKHRLEGLVRMSRGSWFGEIRGDYVGNIQTNDANSTGSAAKDYVLWDVRAGLSGQRVGNIEIAPFVSLANVFNAVYSAAVAVNAFGSRFYEPGPRRAFSAGISATF